MRASKDLYRVLQRELGYLIGSTCVKALPSVRKYSKVRVVLRAPSRPSPWRIEEGQFDHAELMIHCAWRLDSESEVVSGRGDSQRKGGAAQRGLARLEGRRVVTASFEEPGMDLFVGFEGFSLSIFCDHVSELGMLDNYSLTTPRGELVVGTSGALRKK